MTDPFPTRLCLTRYQEAEAPFDDNELDKCIKLAKDLTLPRYYYIKNCILLTRAIGNWNDAELYRLAAEQAYSTALSNAQLRKDQNSLDALEDLREDLDFLITCKTADFKEFADHNDIESERDKHAVGPLVIRSKEEAVDSSTNITKANVSSSIDATSKKTTVQRRPKGKKFSKGGAYNAHVFSKSLGKAGGSAF